MPVHGIKLDAEFAVLVLTALGASVFMTGQVVSNVLLSFLLGLLFFMLGLNLDIRKASRNLHRKQEITIGLIMTYLLVPIVAIGLSTVLPGGLSEAFIALAVSTAAIGSPKVWSNLGKGEGETAHVISAASVLVGLAVVPALLFAFNVDIGFMVKNALIAGLPLAAGLASQRFQKSFLSDFKHHFSKLSVWLLVLIAGVQFQLTLASSGNSFIQYLWLGLFVMAAFVLTVFSTAYRFSKEIGVMERKARSIGFVSSSKEISVALFVAVHLSGAAVLYIVMYYFVRQAVCGAITEYFRYGRSPTLSRLKASFKM